MNDKDREIFSQAENLVNSEPIPLDAMDQLDKLRKNVSKEMRVYFDDFYEGVSANSSSEKPF